MLVRADARVEQLPDGVRPLEAGLEERGHDEGAAGYYDEHAHPCQDDYEHDEPARVLRGCGIEDNQAKNERNPTQRHRQQAFSDAEAPAMQSLEETYLLPMRSDHDTIIGRAIDIDAYRGGEKKG